MVVESAFVIPILLIMSLGGFEVSSIVARHSEMRSAASEAAALVLSTEPEQGDDFSTIEDIVEASTGLADDDVTLVENYRCGNADALTDDMADCGSSDVISTFIVITMSDTYSPLWTEFGVGKDILVTADRTVQIG